MGKELVDNIEAPSHEHPDATRAALAAKEEHDDAAHVIVFKAKKKTTGRVYAAYSKLETRLLTGEAGLTVTARKVKEPGAVWGTNEIEYYDLRVSEGKLTLTGVAQTAHRWFMARFASALTLDGVHDRLHGNQESRFPFLYKMIAQLLRAALSDEAAKSQNCENLLNQLPQLILQATGDTKLLDPKSYTAKFFTKYFANFVHPQIILPIVKHNQKKQLHHALVNGAKEKYNQALRKTLRITALILNSIDKGAFKEVNFNGVMQDNSADGLDQLVRAINNAVNRITGVDVAAGLSEDQIESIVSLVAEKAFTSEGAERENFRKKFHALLTSWRRLAIARDDLVGTLQSLNDSIGAMWLIGGMFNKVALQNAIFLPLTEAEAATRSFTLHMATKEADQGFYGTCYRTGAKIPGATEAYTCNHAKLAGDFEQLFAAGHIVFLKGEVRRDLDKLKTAASALGVKDLMSSSAETDLFKAEGEAGTDTDSFTALPASDEAAFLAAINREYPDDVRAPSSSKDGGLDGELEGERSKARNDVEEAPGSPSVASGSQEGVPRQRKGSSDSDVSEGDEAARDAEIARLQALLEAERRARSASDASTSAASRSSRSPSGAHSPVTGESKLPILIDLAKEHRARLYTVFSDHFRAEVILGVLRMDEEERTAIFAESVKPYSQHKGHIKKANELTMGRGGKVHPDVKKQAQVVTQELALLDAHIIALEAAQDYQAHLTSLDDFFTSVLVPQAELLQAIAAPILALRGTARLNALVDANNNPLSLQEAFDAIFAKINGNFTVKEKLASLRYRVDLLCKALDGIIERPAELTHLRVHLEQLLTLVVSVQNAMTFLSFNGIRDDINLATLQAQRQQLGKAINTFVELYQRNLSKTQSGLRIKLSMASDKGWDDTKGRAVELVEDSASGHKGFISQATDLCSETSETPPVPLVETTKDAEVAAAFVEPAAEPVPEEEKDGVLVNAAAAADESVTVETVGNVIQATNNAALIALWAHATSLTNRATEKASKYNQQGAAKAAAITQLLTAHLNEQRKAVTSDVVTKLNEATYTFDGKEYQVTARRQYRLFDCFCTSDTQQKVNTLAKTFSA